MKDRMTLENKLRIEDEEIAQIREECIRMLTVERDNIHEITQCVNHNGDVKISLEDVRNILTSRIAEADIT